jgi:hypothetical protein
MSNKNEFEKVRDSLVLHFDNDKYWYQFQRNKIAAIEKFNGELTIAYRYGLANGITNEESEVIVVLQSMLIDFLNVMPKVLPKI